ncbi:MAG: pseudaminic acid synthase [Candidatus Omnitrophica bacterium]|nr:pseudaminic acid synthase [Candidatus Omnitrophota bacterium]
MRNFFKRDDSVFVIAEISANHGKNFKRAVSLIKKAKECGVDAVKFQTYTPDTMTLDVKNRHFMIKHPRWGGQTLYQLYKEAYTPWKWFKELKRVAGDAGLTFFSTAFDKTSVDFLENLGVPLHKIASFELVDLPLIEYIAKTKKPLIISTGMATRSEIKDAVNTAKRHGTSNLMLLKCVSSYPAKPQDLNLRTIPDLKKLFKCPVGLSDHSLTTVTSVAAVAQGATIIEKHFTLSRNIKTPDSFFSLEPRELKELVESIRIVEKALGRVSYGLGEEEKKNRVFRRSLFFVKDTKKGEVLTEENIRAIRPASGLKPKYLRSVLNRKAKKNIEKGTPLTKELIS